MARVYTKIGDFFSARLAGGSKKYFQFIASDLTQLNSDVIRVFKKQYPIEEKPSLSKIAQRDIEFYAHCVIKLGVKLGYWEKVGYLSQIGNTEKIIFRSSTDDRRTESSSNWWIWKIGEDQRYVGKLTGMYKEAEIGSVIAPDSILHRMKTGEYDFVYPSIE